MKFSKIIGIISLVAILIVTVSAISENPLKNIISSNEKNSLSINTEQFNKLISSTDLTIPQISQKTKQIATEEVIQKANEQNEIPIIVWLKKGQDAEEVITNLEGFKTKYIYDQLNGFSGTATKEAINKLIKDKRVDYIAFDQAVKAHLSRSRPLIKADIVESNYSIIGTGIGVCHLDTGINYNHQALASAYKGGYDFVNNDNDPFDDNGHGTATAGVIASSGLVIFNSTTARGIAPGVNLLSLKVLDSSGNGFFSDVAAGINWCITNKNQYNISIISMSLGTLNTYNPSNSPGYSDPALQAAYSQNMISVASTGNTGSLTGISYPAVSPYTISVASSYNSNIGTIQFTSGNFSCIDNVTNPDIVSCFSNRANFTDLIAPGSNIATTSLSGGLAAFAGTSLSAPHVTGTIALMKERNPQMTIPQIINILKTTGAPIYDNSTNITFKIINALESVKFVPYMTKIGTLAPGNTITLEISDPANPGSLHIAAMSFGNAPGILLSNGLIVPLNFDALLSASIPPNAIMQNNIGLLDSNGKAVTTFNVPNITGIENWTLYTGFVTARTDLSEFLSVSNSVKL